MAENVKYKVKSKTRDKFDKFVIRDATMTDLRHKIDRYEICFCASTVHERKEACIEASPNVRSEPGPET